MGFCRWMNSTPIEALNFLGGRLFRVTTNNRPYSRMFRIADRCLLRGTAKPSSIQYARPGFLFDEYTMRFSLATTGDGFAPLSPPPFFEWVCRMASRNTMAVSTTATILSNLQLVAQVKERRTCMR